MGGRSRQRVQGSGDVQMTRAQLHGAGTKMEPSTTGGCGLMEEWVVVSSVGRRISLQGRGHDCTAPAQNRSHGALHANQRPNIYMPEDGTKGHIFRSSCRVGVGHEGPQNSTPGSPGQV